MVAEDVRRRARDLGAGGRRGQPVVEGLADDQGQHRAVGERTKVTAARLLNGGPVHFFGAANGSGSAAPKSLAIGWPPRARGSSRR